MNTPIAENDESRLIAVRELLREVPLIDAHSDVPWQIYKMLENRLENLDFSSRDKEKNPLRHTSISRLREGQVGAQVWAIYFPPDMDETELTSAVIEQLKVVRDLINRYTDDLEFAGTTSDIERIHKSGKIACLTAIEGGHMLNNSIEMLQEFYSRGARYLTLTYTKNTSWADSANDTPQHNGLTDFGKSIVREMNRLGMLVDLSHASDATMHAALDVSRTPVIFSHSGARGLVNHPRNVPDDVLKKIALNKGLVMIPFVPYFISGNVEEHHHDAGSGENRQSRPQRHATLQDVADHIDYVRKVAGIDNVGIGSDFEGFRGTIEGLEDVSRYPYLLAELMKRGYSPDDVKKVAGLNFLRVMGAAEEAASSTQVT